MVDRVIPVVEQRYGVLQAPLNTAHIAPTGQLLDQRARALRDLRISVTDRCNFRCAYCMPKEVFDKAYPYLPHKALLSFEEITRRCAKTWTSSSPSLLLCALRRVRSWTSP